MGIAGGGGDGPDRALRRSVGEKRAPLSARRAPDRRPCDLSKLKELTCCTSPVGVVRLCPRGVWAPERMWIYRVWRHSYRPCRRALEREREGRKDECGQRPTHHHHNHPCLPWWASRGEADLLTRRASGACGGYCGRTAGPFGRLELESVGRARRDFMRGSPPWAGLRPSPDAS